LPEPETWIRREPCDGQPLVRQQARLFIGLMSGTSADSIDAALVAFEQGSCRLVSTHNHPLASDLKARIHSLTLPGDNEIERMGALDQHLGEAFAEATLQLLAGIGLQPEQVTAIGSHGQTIRHQPGHSGGPRFTLQIADPHLIAERTGILTIADFRRRDIACGGQGAPLAPAFHYSQFGSNKEPRAIVNIGGIANITALPLSGPVIGFDTGPGNTLLDAWIGQCKGEAFDRNGAWAAGSTSDPPLLNALLRHPFLQMPAPKSTGREDFNLKWLQSVLESYPVTLAPAQIQATLLEFTAVSVAHAIEHHCHAGSAVYVCGGGAHNLQLLKRLQAQLPGNSVDTTKTLGIDPDWVEAAAFAWLAKRYVDGETGNLPSVTGADRAVILGAAYPK
jgi:anhydro-N-acetylmuramic acid kinase